MDQDAQIRAVVEKAFENVLFEPMTGETKDAFVDEIRGGIASLGVEVERLDATWDYESNGIHLDLGYQGREIHCAVHPRVETPD